MMKIPPHLLPLYHKAIRRYKKLIKKLRRQYGNNSIRTYSYQELLQQVSKIRKRILALRSQLKVAVAAGGVVMLMNTAPANAQSTLGPFALQTRNENPLRGPIDSGQDPSPAIVDLDNDGDFDLLLGEESGPLRFFQNTGTKNKAFYIELTGTANPFNGIVPPGNPAPTFADLNKDGDKDLFLGNSNGTIQYFENTGSSTNPVFTERTGTSNPVGGVDIVGTSSPTFADIDADGDLDLLVGGDYNDFPAYSSIVFYQNNNNVFTQQSSPLYSNRSSLSLAAVNLDSDDDLEIIAGSDFYYLEYYDFNGESYVLQEGSSNPFYYRYIYSLGAPAFADMDNDGDSDLIAGHHRPYYDEGVSTLLYLENNGDNTFNYPLDTESPIGGIDVSQRAAPTLMDYDGDGDLDAVIGSKYSGKLTYYQNNNGTYEHIAGADADPFYDTGISGYFNPAFGDLDGDDVPEIVAGYSWGDMIYFKKDGNFYLEVTGTSNPLDTINGGNRVFAELVDIDADGDLDLFSSDSGPWPYDGGTVRFYKNTGTPLTPTFTLAPAAENPLSPLTLVYGGDKLIHFKDVDHDGDFDLVVGASDLADNFIIDYWENTGTATAPVFMKSQHQFLSAFNDMPHAQAKLFDSDSDGDLDVFIGMANGQILYSKNENLAPETTVSTSGVVISVKPGFAPVVIDNDITISDSDNDLIVEARVSIQNYVKGNIALTFTPQENITGSFNADTGVLTLRGKAPISAYQAALRTVAGIYNSGGGGSKSSKRSMASTDTEVAFQVFDIDYTTPAAVIKRVTFSEGAVEVFNAVAPKSLEHDNRWLRITNLPAQNKVTIFNRWGDKVYEMANYDSNEPGKRFEGIGDNGKELATGTYFYKIEFGSESVTGYLSLKQ